jgi:TolA-binding protein
MKRTERQHLKDNELANLAAGARELVEARRNQVLGIAIGVLVLVVGIGAYFAWRSSVEGRAGARMAEAVMLDEARIGAPAADGTTGAAPSFPTVREKLQAQLTKFHAVAEEFPSTDAGLFARYREGATLLLLDQPKDAAASFQLIVDRSSSSLYGKMAKLGVAEAQARAGQFDQAIAIYNELAQRKDDVLPVDGVLIQLGRAYRDAGKRAEAEQAFNRIITEFPGSSFSDEARREIDNLKKA